MELALLVYFANFVETLRFTLWFVLSFLVIWTFFGFMSSRLDIPISDPAFWIVSVTGVTIINVLVRDK